MQDPTWIVPLTDPVCASVAEAGGKAAELHRLITEGYPVPEAAVVTVSVFRQHIPGANRPTERPMLHSALTEALTDLAGRLCPEEGDYLVVRSSAESEDGAAASFAGQHATYYYITADTVEKAVVDCWLSLWSEAATSYREGLAVQDDAPAMGVIIQRMIQAERSGVCFTEDPTGATRDSAIIESTWGLGAALVDGRVSPDRIWVSEQGIEDRRIARKRLKVSEDLRDADGPRLEPVPLRQQTAPSLSDVEAGQIAAMARAIADARGLPQDIEWAIDGDQLFLLQARPMTAVSPAPPPRVEGRWVIFKPAAENFSEPFTPMTMDLISQVMPRMARFIQGRFYIDVDLMAKLLPWRLDDDQLSDILLMRETGNELPLHGRNAFRMGALLSLAYLGAGVTWHRTAHLPLEKLSSFEERCLEVLADPSLDPLAALRKLITNDHPFKPISGFVIQANMCSVRYFVLVRVLEQFLARFAPDFDRTKLAIICSGGSAMLSQQMVEDIRGLAAIAKQDPDLVAALDAPALSIDEEHTFARAFQGFLQRFGHRGVRELDLVSPRWREDTATVIAMIRNYLVDADENGRIDSHGLLLATEDELHQSLPRRWQRLVVDRLVERIRFYVTLRENTRHYHTMGFAAVREKLKRLEYELIQAERLRCEDDIFFLTHDETMALSAGALDWPDVEDRIRERRLTYHRLAQARPTEAYNLDLRVPVLEPEGNVLVGDCASPGVATGIARVIHDPGIAADLAPGDILVAPYTDPAWTPLFPRSSAVVVEVGSYLSHAGTVAREYQIPCLVDVNDCTRKIRTGQRLRVNATEGWVEVVS
jgi:pyruvate,water dikinase